MRYSFRQEVVVAEVAMILVKKKVLVEVLAVELDRVMGVLVLEHPDKATMEVIVLLVFVVAVVAQAQLAVQLEQHLHIQECNKAEMVV